MRTEASAVPQVSIVVPVYDVVRYVDECLSSIAAQTFGEIEVIVVDDGSTDGSGEVCDQWAAKDPRFVVVHQRNRGLSAARNVGLAIASASYVQFVDSDDYVDPRYTELLLRAARKSGCPCVMCGHVREQTSGWKEIVPYSRPTVVDAHDCMRSAMNASRNNPYHITAAVWNRIYERALFEDNDIRFPEGHVFEDVHVMSSLLYHSRSIALIPDVLYYKHKRGDSIVHTDSVQNCLDVLHAQAVLSDDVGTLYPDLLPLARRSSERTRVVYALRLVGVKDDAILSGLFDGFRKDAIAHWRDLSLPRDARYALALLVVAVSPKAAARLYRMWHKLRGT